LPLKERVKVSGLSATGESLDLVAPGVQVLTTYPPDRYALATGTSQAAFVTGVAALIVAKHLSQGGGTPVHTPVQMIEHLRRCAVDIEQPGFDVRSGCGLIDPTKLLAGAS
jgi:major intracellular serine protease